MLYGVIGRSLKHSFSPEFFKEKFLRENLLQHSYRVFELKDPGGLIPLIKKYPLLRGLNVTIPFKSSIIPLLDDCDETARITGAVNTVKISRTQEKIYLSGFNTDVWGFENSTNAFQHFRKALILGTGGAAKAISFVLGKWGIEYLFVSRVPGGEGSIAYQDLDEQIMREYRFIINTTPLGMYPSIAESPGIPYRLLGKGHFLYDLIYNPPTTSFLRQGRAAGAQVMNGCKMLELQAERSWEIWHT